VFVDPLGGVCEGEYPREFEVFCQGDGFVIECLEEGIECCSVCC
jgi:hypothetical protein